MSVCKKHGKSPVEGDELLGYFAQLSLSRGGEKSECLVGVKMTEAERRKICHYM